MQLWEKHELAQPSNMESLKARIKHSKLRGDMLLHKNLLTNKEESLGNTSYYVAKFQDSIES